MGSPASVPLKSVEMETLMLVMLVGGASGVTVVLLLSARLYVDSCPVSGLAPLALTSKIAKTKTKAIEEAIGTAEARAKLFSFVFVSRAG